MRFLPEPFQTPSICRPDRKNATIVCIASQAASMSEHHANAAEQVERNGDGLILASLCIMLGTLMWMMGIIRTDLHQ